MELHRRYDVMTHRRVPAAKFAEVVTWLEEWLGRWRPRGNRMPAVIR